MEYEIIIGLEVHAELSTNTKIYCGCKNSFGAEVNTNCCPICMGMPGTLPTLNKTVVEYAVKMGHALNCNINRVCKQDRKNYFYPDLPKSYQISQFDIPLCENGYVDVIVDESGQTMRIGVTRIHIEEDAGKLLHDDSFFGSLVDFNRCGVPLIEIVSEPDMRTAAQAKAYLETIRAILGYIDISDCKMQEGSIRCDVNVSVRPVGQKELGTRCEMKNVNTFSGAVRGIEYEAKRQIEVLESGGTIVQETRRWDDIKGVSVPLRSKEDAHDYRYFPEPDLLTIVVEEKTVQEIKESLPELPNKRTIRFMKEYSLPHFDANLLIENREKADFFEETVKQGTAKPKSIANWILTGVVITKTLTPKKLAELAQLVEKGEISNTAGKTVLEELCQRDTTPAQVIAEKGLKQISDNTVLEDIAREVIAENPQTIEQYRNGKTNVLAFLVGQCMRKSKGTGNPAVLNEIILGFLK